MTDKRYKVLKSIESCKRLFARFDEIWFVGNRADLCRVLLDLGIIQKSKITVVYALNLLGLDIDTKNIITPDVSSLDFMSIQNTISREVNDRIRESKLAHKKVVIVTHSPNKSLDNAILNNDAGDYITVVSPCTSYLYEILEQKNTLNSIFSQMRSVCNIDDHVIKSTRILGSDTFESICERLGSCRSLFLQQNFSAGGAGASVVNSARAFEKAIYRSSGYEMKASEYIEHAYSANGSALIMPAACGCKVYTDRLSHKLMEANILRTGGFCGVGNDWTIGWSTDINMQYRQVATAVGNVLYRVYGYTGIVGLDFLVCGREYNKLKITEINPRIQGTTPYQAYNSIFLDSVPLLLAYFIVKLGSNEDKATLLDMLETSSSCDNGSGLFYLKILSSSKQIKQDMNGVWQFSNNIGEIHYYGKEVNLPNLYMYGDNKDLITIRGSSKKEYMNNSPVAAAYIIGRGRNVFSKARPAMTDFGANLYSTIRDKIYEI